MQSFHLLTLSLLSHSFIMQLVLDTIGLVLKVKSKRFHVVKDDRERTISPKKISSIAVTVGCMISSQAIALAAKHEVPIIFFDRLGRPTARLWSPYFGSLADLRRRQSLFGLSKQATKWAIGLFKLKLEGQLHNLNWLANRKPSRREALEKNQLAMVKIAAEFDQHIDKQSEEARGHLMGIEGSIARMYWQAIAACMPETLLFEGRSRQPAKDYFNALLNYVYGMLYSVVEGAAFAVGLDPHLGVLHADQYDQSTLTFDLIEPFRAWIDRMLLEACLRGILDDPSFYRAKGKGVMLDKAGKRVVIPLFNDYMEQVKQHDGKRFSRKNHIYRFVQLFANQLKDIDPLNLIIQ